MFDLTSVCKIFEFFGKTTGENLIAFKIDCGGIFVAPSLFDKGFNFESIVTNIFVIFFSERKGITLCVECVFLRVELFFENLEEGGPVIFILLGETVIPIRGSTSE